MKNDQSPDSLLDYRCLASRGAKQQLDMITTILSALRTALTVFLFCICSIQTTSAQQATGVRLKRVTLSSLAGSRLSGNLRTAITSDAIIGSAGLCPAGTLVTTGFLSINGTTSPPVVLSAGHNEIEAEDIDLSWTGRALEFHVYRSTSPENLSSVENLFGVTSTCGDTDQTAVIDPGVVLYYQVEVSSQP